MNIEFIENQIPLYYSKPQPIPCLEQSKEYNGQTYTLLGISEKTYSFRDRIWLAIRAFAETVFSLGLGLFFETTRNDWKSFWTGKRNIMLYSSSSILSEQILANRGDALAQFK